MVMLGARPNAPGFTYDGRHSSEFNLIMLRSPISVMPPIEPKLIQVPGRAGAYLGPVQIRERIIQVEVALWAGTERDRREMARAIAAWLDPTNGARDLSFDTEPGRFYRAILAGGIDLEQSVIGRTTLEFVATDPYAYGELEQAQFMITENGQSVTLENAGNVATPVQLVIKNQGDTPINGFTLICYKIE